MEKGTTRRIGDEGRFASATRALMHQGRMYTLDRDGYLYRWNLDDLAWDKLGESPWQARFLLATPMWLISVEDDGSVWAVDPNRGSRSELGKNPRFEGALGAALAGPDEVVICDSSGDLHSLWIGERTQSVRVPGGGANAAFLFGGEGYVHVQKNDGTVWRVRTNDKETAQVGTGDWTGTTAAAGADGIHYLCCKGALYENDVNNGKWTQLGDASTWTSTMLMAGKGAVYSFEQDGSLWEIGV